MNGKLLVQKVSETTRFDHAGKATQYYQVDYTVGDHGPFSELFPKESFTAADARAKLQQHVDQLQQLTQY